MQKPFTFVAALGFAALAALPLHAETDASTVAAVVNGEEITLGHISIAVSTLPQQYRELPPDVLYGAVLDQLVSQALLRQANGDRMPNHVKLSLENETRSLLAAEEVERVMQNAASEADIKAAYDERFSNTPGDEEFNASHILVESEEEAKAIKTQIDDGADFAETAKASSTGPSGPNGGSLGWFGKGAMVPAFETAVVGMEAGDVSDPIQTQFGWHVIKLNDKRIKQAPELDAVRAEIERELRTQAVEQRIEALTLESDIERPDIPDLNVGAILNLDFVRK